MIRHNPDSENGFVPSDPSENEVNGEAENFNNADTENNLHGITLSENLNVPDDDEIDDEGVLCL